MCKYIYVYICVCVYIYLYIYIYVCMYVYTGEGNGNPFQYSCLENPMDGGAWWATVHSHKQSDTTQRLHVHFSYTYTYIYTHTHTHTYIYIWQINCQCNVQFHHSVVSDSFQVHHARPPCPSPTLRVYSDSCSLSQWWHPTIPSSIFPFSSCLHSFPASGSFPVSQFFASDC